MTTIPVRWRMAARQNGSIEIRHGRRLVAIVTRDHPDMMGNAIACQMAPAMLAAAYNLRAAFLAEPDPHAPPQERAHQDREISYNLHVQLIRAVAIATEYDNALASSKPPRRSPR